VEVAKMVASALGIDEDGIEWKETVSNNREPFLENGQVDIVVATYSITDERKKGRRLRRPLLHRRAGPDGQEGRRLDHR
jgi:hypothetical protein